MSTHGRVMILMTTVLPFFFEEMSFVSDGQGNGTMRGFPWASHDDRTLRMEFTTKAETFMFLPCDLVMYLL